MNYIRGHTEDEKTIACLVLPREGLECEERKHAQQELEAVHALL